MYYLYDGAGRRVQAVSTYNVEKVFVYDAFGQMAAEYSLGAQSLPCTTCYIATDHLGSTRMVTDQNANVVGRHDYLPFGEEIAANTGGRNSNFGTQDFVNQKFTGQERDSETGLDFFQARYFSAALGRFNSPDPENAGASLFNPQSWNAYTYVYNNPLSLVDPTGLTTCDENGDNCHDTITVPGGPPDPVPTDPCWYSNCGGVGGGGYGDSPLQTAQPPSPPPPSVISVPNGSSSNNCVAGFTAAGAGTGAAAGAWLGGGIGGVSGAGGGTLLAPGFGTVGGAVLGGEAGAAGGL
jgi:RHS repeat-associated protein